MPLHWSHSMSASDPYTAVFVSVSAKVLLKTHPTWSALLTRRGTASRPPLRCARRPHGRSVELLPVRRHMTLSVALFTASELAFVKWFESAGCLTSFISRGKTSFFNCSSAGLMCRDQWLRVCCNEAVFLLQVAFQTAWRTASTKSSSHRPRIGPAWTLLLFIQNSMEPTGTANYWQIHIHIGDGCCFVFAQIFLPELPNWPYKNNFTIVQINTLFMFLVLLHVIRKFFSSFFNNVNL